MDICPFQSYRATVIDEWRDFFSGKITSIVWEQLTRDGKWKHYKKIQDTIEWVVFHNEALIAFMNECNTWVLSTVEERVELFRHYWMNRIQVLAQDNTYFNETGLSSSWYMSIDTVVEWLEQWLNQFIEIVLHWMRILHYIHGDTLPENQMNHLKKSLIFSSMMHINGLSNFSPLNFDLWDKEGRLYRKSNVISSKVLSWPRLWCPAHSVLWNLFDCFISFVYKNCSPSSPPPSEISKI